jgi:AcrR family transcriptional regulator
MLQNKKHIERKKREQENMKKRILQAALDIAIADGWENVSIRKIADAVEYTTSIVYSHFPSKDAMLQELVEMGFTALNEKFRQGIANEPNPEQQLMTISLINWDFAYENSALYQLMFAYGKPTSETALKASVMIDEIFSRLTGKEYDEIRVLRLNWLCLRQGAISCLMSNEKEEVDKNKQLYIKFIERFLSSLKL